MVGQLVGGVGGGEGGMGVVVRRGGVVEEVGVDDGGAGVRGGVVVGALGIHGCRGAARKG